MLMDQTVELERLRHDLRDRDATIHALIREKQALEAKLARAIVLPEPVPKPVFAPASASEAARQHQLAVEHERVIRESGDADDVELASTETDLARDRLAESIASHEARSWPDAPDLRAA